MNWLYYLLEANLYLGVFYLAYCLFLNKETHYVFNRVYLIASCVIAFVLPVLQVSSLKQYFVPDTTPVAVVPAYIVTPMPEMVYTIATPSPQPVFTAEDALYYGYWIGAAIVLILLVTKLVSLFRLISSKPVLNHDTYKLIYLDDLNTAFSFFNYLFIGRRANNSPIIIRHELVHIRQKHSFDILFIEVLKVVNWFNPFIYLLQKSLKTVHEYIADEESLAEDTDTTTYSAFLVNNAYGLSGPSITHSFYTYNLLKNRIIMLHQKRSGSLARLKYLITVPIGAGLLCASTMAFSKTYGWIDLSPLKPAATKDVKLDPPYVIEDAYSGLKDHLTRNIRYKTTDLGKAKSMFVEFTVTHDHKLSDVTFQKNFLSAHLKDQLQSLISSYSGTINDQPGKHTLAIILNSANEFIRINPAVKASATYAGEIVLIVPPAPPQQKLPPSLPQPPNPKTDQVRFPPPIVKPYFTPMSERNFRAFAGLREYLAKNIQYPDAAREKKISGVTTAKFDVDDNGNITDSSIDISGANDFNEVVLAGLNTYSGKISVKKGSYNIVFTFRAGKNDQLKFPPTTSNRTSFAGIVNIATDKSFLIDRVKFPPPIVRPDKSGQLKRKELPPPPEPPKPKVDQIKFPPPVIKQDKSVQELKVAGKRIPPLPKEFSQFLAKNIRYPADAKNNNTQGRVIVQFNTNTDGLLTNPQIISGIGKSCDDEVLRVFNAYKDGLPRINATYIFVVSMMLDNVPPSPPLEPVNNSIKNAPNYGGEVVIVAYGPRK